MVEKYSEDNCEMALILRFGNDEAEWKVDIFTFDVNESDENGCIAKCTYANQGVYDSDYEDD